MSLRGGTALREIVRELREFCATRLVGLAIGPDGVDAAPLLAGLSGPASAAVEMALIDLASKHADVPAWQVLGAEEAEPIECNATLAAGRPDAVARDASAWLEDGFRTFKLKVGVPGDAAQVEAVREGWAQNRGSGSTPTASGRRPRPSAAWPRWSPTASSWWSSRRTTSGTSPLFARRPDRDRRRRKRRRSRRRAARGRARGLHARDREARQDRRDRTGARGREAPSRLPVECPRRPGRDRRRSPRAAGDPKRWPAGFARARPRDPAPVRRHDRLGGMRASRGPPAPAQPAGPRAWRSTSGALERHQLYPRRATAYVRFAPVDPTNRNTALASAMVEELARCGCATRRSRPGRVRHPWHWPCGASRRSRSRSSSTSARPASSRSAPPRPPAAPRRCCARRGPLRPTSTPPSARPTRRGAADRLDRRPPARAARDRRRADDRPAEAIRVAPCAGSARSAPTTPTTPACSTSARSPAAPTRLPAASPARARCT